MRQDLTMQGFLLSAFFLFMMLTAAFADESSMQFSIQDRDGDRYILAEGLIDKTSDQKFVAFLKANAADAPTKIRLESRGGDLFAALRIGYLIREIGFSTEVREGSCYSACVYTFLGGADRNADAYLLGVHHYAVRVIDPTPQKSALFNVIEQDVNQVLDQMLGQYITSMGGTAFLMELAKDTPHDSLHRLDDADLERSGLLTGPTLAVTSLRPSS